MSGAMLRRGLLAVALFLGFAAGALAQQPAAKSPAIQQQGFPTADAAAEALAKAVRDNDQKAIAAMWGANWRDFVPGTNNDVQRRRGIFLKAWDENHKIIQSGDAKAQIEVGKAGWTLPIPLAKDGAEWRFDVAAGLKEMVFRRIGHDEAAVIQTLLAIVDAQSDYAAMDPMKTGAPSYARRLLSSPGKKDGLYWDAKPGEPPSPLGAAVAKARRVSTRCRCRRMRLLASAVRDSRAPNIRLVQVGARDEVPFAPVFDRVIVDAPCSGLGTVRRDPDIRWRRTEAQLPGFAAYQETLLARAARAVTTGGRLVYATCSSEPEENEGIAHAFLATTPGFTALHAGAATARLADTLIDRRGHLRTQPDRHGLEAFFGAVFERR